MAQVQANNRFHPSLDGDCVFSHVVFIKYRYHINTSVCVTTSNLMWSDHIAMYTFVARQGLSERGR